MIHTHIVKYSNSLVLKKCYMLVIMKSGRKY